MAKKKTTVSKEETATSPTPADAGYTVVARRYRPQQLADLVGQDAPAQSLANAIKTGRVAHAYLFTGARGVGKTSTARILAKCLNCEKGPTDKPCDVCDMCQAISVGEDIDVIEIDGASNNGVDEVRELRATCGTRPARARFKIYIIDEVHMLSKAAFNALLKTLEEPPAHVKFVFATTEVQKIPLTILSRCQRFDFGSITTAKIAQRLKEVVKAEGFQADDDALTLIARRAAGSMRDGQSLLDQLMSSSSDKLTVKQVHHLLGSADEERILPLVEAILARDPALVLKTLSQFADDGLLLTELIDQVVEYWRYLMLANCGGIDAIGDYLPDKIKEAVTTHAKKQPIDGILAGLDVLTAAKGRLRNSNHPQLLLEMALVRLCRLDDLVSVGQLVQMLSSGEAAAPRAASAPAATGDKKKLESVAPHANGTPGGMDIESAWRKMLGDTMMLQTQVRVARKSVDDAAGRIDLLFPQAAEKSFQAVRLPATVEKIQHDLEKLTGRKWTVKVELAEGGTEHAGMPKATVTLSRKDREERLKEYPLTRSIIDRLGARVLHVDDGFNEQPAALAVGEEE